MDNVLSYTNFIEQHYYDCKNSAWFPDVLAACSDLETDDLTISGLVGEIHEGLRLNFEEAVKYFWTIFLINPLIAIKAYQETDLLLGKVDVYATFKQISPIYSYENQFMNNFRGIYNTSVEYFLIFAIEALLQKEMNSEMLDAIYHHYLAGLYDHDKVIMSNKSYYHKNGITPPSKWINHRNLRHILNAIDPHHIIILLEFFADKYGARLSKGNVGEYCYSKDKYEYIIHFIKKKYGSLSEYIEWEDCNYYYHYQNYYLRSLDYYEMYQYMDIIFPTKEDKKRIQSGDDNYWLHRARRIVNSLKRSIK